MNDPLTPFAGDHPSDRVPHRNRYADQTQAWGRTEPQEWLQTYLSIFKRRKWLIRTLLIIMVPLIVLEVFMQAPTFEATATLLINPATPRVVNIAEVIPPDGSLEYYKAQYDLIKSQALIERLVKTLEAQPGQQIAHAHEGGTSLIDSIQKFASKIKRILKEKIIGSRNTVSLESAEVERRNQILTLQKRIQVVPISRRLINVTLSGTNPYEITGQVNALAHLYVEQNLENKLQATQRASTWLTQEVKTLKAEVERAERALQEFIETRELIPVSPNGEHPNLALREFHDLATAYTALKRQRVDLEIRLEEVEQLVQRPVEQLPRLVIMLDNGLIETLWKQHEELEIQLAELSGQFKSSHPKIISTRKQIDIIKNNIKVGLTKYVESLLVEYSILLNKIGSFKRIIYENKIEIIESNKDVNMYTALQQDIISKRKIYESILERLNETKISKNLQENNTTIIQEALVPIKPISINKMLKLTMSVFLILIFVCGVAIVADSLDMKFKSLDDVEEYLHIPSLSLIPAHASNIQNGLVMLDHSRSDISDSYRLMRTNIQMYAMEQHLMSLLITSAVAGEGKTTITANLGIAFAQLGMRVLLVDADLRRPSLHKMFNISNDAGLSNVLINNDSLNTTLQDTEIKNLKLLTSGPLFSNLSELLNINYIKSFCQNIEDRFDMVIFDAAIILTIPETLVLASAVDKVCLVHNPARGDKGKVAKAKKILERSGANILGITINNIDIKNPLYEYDQYYNDNDDRRGKERDIEIFNSKILMDLLEKPISGLWKYLSHNRQP